MRRFVKAAAAVAALALTGQSAVPLAATPAQLRARIKHVFIIYQENHSFDNYFGTYPGADNLASADGHSHGFRQYDPIGKSWIERFRITDPDIEGLSQSRSVALQKIDHGKMDAFVSAQERVSLKRFGSEAAARSAGMETMAYYDCDTIPFLWKYAHAFTLFDRMFSAMTAPSTPNNIEVIAAQAGQTQSARDRAATAAPRDRGAGVPALSDIDPAFGPYTQLDRVKQIPQRYATLMLLVGGAADAQAAHDTQGVAEDLRTAIATRRAAIPWGWFQEGYVSPTAVLPGYVTHHNALQYFGYLRNNDVFWKNVHGLQALLQALKDGTLAAAGVFYVKGSSQNQFGWKPANPDPYVRAQYRGDDDHPGPGDADHQIGESFVATFVNAVARSRYWNDSAILIGWDDPGGFYDHVAPPQFEACPDLSACGDGQRLPFIVISPFARSGAIVHDSGDTSSILKLVETVLGTTSAGRPSRRAAVSAGGPARRESRDRRSARSVRSAKLDGSAPPIGPANAEIPDAVVNAFPPAMNCRSLGIVPVTLPNDPSTPPPGFVPRIRPRRAD